VENFMSLPLKRKEGLREGLQRVSDRRLQEVLRVMGQQGLTAEPVHEARKAIKGLRATLRLTRGALTVEERKARNQALGNLARRLSGPRDAAVTLAAFEKIYRENLDGNRRHEIVPRWAVQLQKSLTAQARAVVPDESYRDAIRGLRRLSGQLLPFEDARRESDWNDTVGKGLRRTYREGRRLLSDVTDAPEPPEKQWHELRKRAKDLGYQVALLKKVKGVKPLLAKLEEVGSALGDARDLSLLREYLDKAQDENELTPAERQSYQHLLARIDQQRQGLHTRALQAARCVYQRGGKRFTDRMAKRWRRWKEG
jgi:CHAD domain-containing protein